MGGVDVVFNNAGYGMAGPLEGLTDEQMLRMVNTNLMGPIRTTKAFIPHFREKKAGLFINTTSIGGLITVPFNSMYHATKWALEGWSESMAFELNQLGIGMKILEPGGMKTDFFTRSFDTADIRPMTRWLTRSWRQSPIRSRWRRIRLLTRSPRSYTRPRPTERTNFAMWPAPMPKRLMLRVCN